MLKALEVWEVRRSLKHDWEQRGEDLRQDEQGRSTARRLDLGRGNLKHEDWAGYVVPAVACWLRGGAFSW